MSDGVQQVESFLERAAVREERDARRAEVAS